MSRSCRYCDSRVTFYGGYVYCTYHIETQYHKIASKYNGICRNKGVCCAADSKVTLPKKFDMYKWLESDDVVYEVHPNGFVEFKQYCRYCENKFDNLNYKLKEYENDKKTTDDMIYHSTNVINELEKQLSLEKTKLIKIKYDAMQFNRSIANDKKFLETMNMKKRKERDFDNPEERQHKKFKPNHTTKQGEDLLNDRLEEGEIRDNDFIVLPKFTIDNNPDYDLLMAEYNYT